MLAYHGRTELKDAVLTIMAEHEAADRMDYFAAKAMAAMVVSGMGHWNCEGDEQRYAIWAYRYADAMLAERERVK